MYTSVPIVNWSVIYELRSRYPIYSQTKFPQNTVAMCFFLYTTDSNKAVYKYKLKFHIRSHSEESLFKLYANYISDRCLVPFRRCKENGSLRSTQSRTYFMQNYAISSLIMYTNNPSFRPSHANVQTLPFSRRFRLHERVLQPLKMPCEPQSHIIQYRSREMVIAQNQLFDKAS